MDSPAHMLAAAAAVVEDRAKTYDYAQLLRARIEERFAWVEDVDPMVEMLLRCAPLPACALEVWCALCCSALSVSH